MVIKYKKNFLVYSGV